jgi:hypothetical protein
MNPDVAPKLKEVLMPPATHEFEAAAVTLQTQLILNV